MNLLLLPEFILIYILSLLDEEGLIVAMKSCFELYDVVVGSRKLTNKLKLYLNINHPRNISNIDRKIRYTNAEVLYLEDTTAKPAILSCLYSYKIKNIIFKFCKFEDYQELYSILQSLEHLTHVHFESCLIKKFHHLEKIHMSQLKLNSIAFNDCNEKLYKFFRKQNSIEKVCVISHQHLSEGFPHSEFDDLVKSLTGFKCLKFFGKGTGGYFDRSKFPFYIEKLECDEFYYWHVGMTDAKSNLLAFQKGSLRELRMMQFPYGIGGGRVLKFIIEEMNLRTFYHADIPLILSNQKQIIKHISANETQIQAVFEMFKQFPGIESFKLILNDNELPRDEIENSIIDFSDNLFTNLKKFEVIDKSGYRRFFGIFLLLLKKFDNLETLSIKTQDKYLNMILKECLPQMQSLRQIMLDTMAPNAAERLLLIKNNSRNLKTIYVWKQFLSQAHEIFGHSSIKVLEI